MALPPGASKTASLAAAHARAQYDCPVVREFAPGRDILRSAKVIQANRGADRITAMIGDPERTPVSFLDGEPHKQRRAQIARFFTPKAMKERYRPVMEASTAKLTARLRASGREQLDLLSFELACDVTSQIIGLTNSNSRAMAQRIRKSFTNLSSVPKSPIGRFFFRLGKLFHLQLFYQLDVKPAIRARRRQPGDDVLSQIMAKKYPRKAVLIECQTYGSAGMMTTREFIVAAAWHLLEDAHLRSTFLSGGEQVQFAILDEILRLDPVVTHSHRRAIEDFTTADGQQIKAGSYYAIDLRAANLDPAIVGENPEAIDITRSSRQRMTSSWMSFADGPHRCPGAQLALHETRVFLDALLRLPGIRLANPPEPSWTGTTYELHGAYVECDRADRGGNTEPVLSAARPSLAETSQGD